MKKYIIYGYDPAHDKKPYSPNRRRNNRRKLTLLQEAP